MPQLERVASSSIEAVGYDPDRQELYIRFRETGETYVYYDVDAWVHVELMQSDSKGAFVNARVKPYYEAAKL